MAVFFSAWFCALGGNPRVHGTEKTATLVVLWVSRRRGRGDAVLLVPITSKKTVVDFVFCVLGLLTMSGKFQFCLCWTVVNFTAMMILFFVGVVNLKGIINICLTDDWRG